MLFKTKTLLVALTALTAFTGSARAATLDFSDLTSGSCAFVGSPVISQGYRFTDVSAGGLFLCNGFVIHNATNPALIAANTRSVLEFGRADGALFSLQSFAAGSRTSTGSTALGIEVVGTTDDDTVTQIFNFTNLDFTTHVLNAGFTGLSSVRITALGEVVAPEFLINAITVDSAGAIPEPAAWAMLISGFGLIGATQRRRRLAAAAHSA